MMKKLLISSLVLAGLSAPVALPAQERILTVFGDDKCPANTICVRAPEAERFRIPKELRGPSTNPENQSWASRGAAVVSTGSTAPSASCSATGAAGWSGCWAQQMRKAKEERKADSEDGQTDNGGLRKVILGDE